jgi:alkanesulfonate monooxygenase SsuD/methylene tetrahydromethanopterin reductase-like flavin-dependent oxidoreductase (luciferase family)
MGQHHGPPTLQQQIDSGSIVCGSPDSVARQLKRLYDSIGCGVVELSFAAPGGSRDAKLHSMELFATKVLPQVREL